MIKNISLLKEQDYGRAGFINRLFLQVVCWLELLIKY